MRMVRGGKSTVTNIWSDTEDGCGINANGINRIFIDRTCIVKNTLKNLYAPTIKPGTSRFVSQRIVFEKKSKIYVDTYRH